MSLVAYHFRVMRGAQKAHHEGQRDACVVKNKETGRWFVAKPYLSRAHSSPRIGIFGDHGGTTGVWATLDASSTCFHRDYEVIHTAESLKGGR